MENVIRNLVTILAYLKKENLISTSALQSYLQGNEDDESKSSTTSLDLALTTFLHKHTDPTKVSQASAHSDWSAVVSNIPYIAYTRISTSSTYNKWPGYIRIPAQDLKLNETLESFLATQKYTLVPDDDKESVLYEMQPTFRNFIIILNNLLHLNLFDDRFPMTFTNPDFVKTYLPKLLTKLHAKLNDTLSSDLDAINKADYSGEKSSITLEFIAKVGQCRITLDKDHGAFTTDRYKGAVKLPFFQENLAYYHILPTSALFFHHDNPDTICSLKDPKAMYLALFATKIDNPDVASALSENTCLFNHKNIFNLLRHCISRHADPLQRLKSILIFYDTYCKSKVDRELDGDIYKHALATIEEASTMYSNLDPAVASTLPPYVLKLLKTLSVSKQYASVFMQFFPTFITTTPITYLDTSLLFHDAIFMELLLKNRQQIDQAVIQKIEDAVIGQAQKAMVMNPNEENFALKKALGVQAIENLQQLVTNGFSNIYAKALEIALDASNTYYPLANDSIDNAANKLLASLIQQGIGKNEIEEGLADNRKALYKRLFTLQMAEPAAGFYFPAAIPIINALIHKNWCVEKITDQLIDNLYLDELHTTGGDYTTIYVMKGDNYTPLINERITRIAPLIEQQNGYACKEAVQAAQRLWQGKRWNDYDYEDDTKPAAKQEAVGLAKLLLTYNKDVAKSLPDDLLQAATKELAAQKAKAPESNKDEKKQ